VNIGIVSYNTQRGLYHLSLLFQEALKELKYNVFTITNPNHERLPTLEFVFDSITQNNIDTIISFESNAKSSLGVNNLIQAKKELGTKLIEVPMVDCFGSKWLNSRVLDNFDSIICVSQFAYNIFKEANYDNIVLLRPGFKKNTRQLNNSPNITYFHPSGAGGVKHVKRKNSLEVLQAFSKVLEVRDDINLIFSSQLTRPKFYDFYPNDKIFLEDILKHSKITSYFSHIPREQFLNLYNNIDVLCYPTKKEGIGLCTLEAISYGIPIIVTNMSPYNEFIIDNKNGWLCNTNIETQYRDFYTKLCYIDVDYLAKLIVSLDKDTIISVGKESSKILDIYSWDLFVTRLKKIVGG
jgi:glycosyltransferase involved in cell wall biosynthesis